MHSLLNELRVIQERRIPAAMCTIVKTEGSTPLKAGAKMIVRGDRTIAGTVGGGALEHSVIGQAINAIGTKQSDLFEHRLVRDHQMCCGGTVHIFIEPITLPPQLVIFGAGHVGKALARASAEIDFAVTVIDDRSGIFKDWPTDIASRHINMAVPDAIDTITWDSDTYIVIATYSHALDRQALRLCIDKQFAYCGMIGSKRKVIITRRLFLEQCWATEEILDRIDMPIGIDIGAETPQEIAVSIAAKLIEVRRGHTPPQKKEIPKQSNTESTLTNGLCDTATLAKVLLRT